MIRNVQVSQECFVLVFVKIFLQVLNSNLVDFCVCLLLFQIGKLKEVLGEKTGNLMDFA